MRFLVSFEVLRKQEPAITTKLTTRMRTLILSRVIPFMLHEIARAIEYRTAAIVLALNSPMAPLLPTPCAPCDTLGALIAGRAARGVVREVAGVQRLRSLNPKTLGAPDVGVNTTSGGRDLRTLCGATSKCGSREPGFVPCFDIC